jgi:hypothetical protein
VIGNLNPTPPERSSTGLSRQRLAYFFTLPFMLIISFFMVSPNRVCFASPRYYRGIGMDAGFSFVTLFDQGRFFNHAPSLVGEPKSQGRTAKLATP